MHNPIKLVKHYWLVLSLLTLIAITFLSLTPLPSLPLVPGSDKTHHFIAYGVLMFPTALRKPKYWPLVALFFIAFSGVIEILQPYVNRYGEWLDLLANALGIIICMALVTIVRFLKKKMCPLV